MLELKVESLGKVEDWLETVPSKYTKKNYKAGVKRFEAWHGKSITTLIGSPDASKVLLKFYVYLKNKHCQNTARNQTNSCVQFLQYFKTEIDLPPYVWTTEISLKDHPLSIGELRSMNSLANLKEQLVLELGLLGFRIGDIITLKKSDFNLDAEPPIEFNIRARKEGTVYRSFVSTELRDLLKLYLPAVKGEWLFEGQKEGTHAKADTLNKIIKSLAERANIKLHGHLHWHCFRKMIMRRGTELQLNSWAVNMLVGKAVHHSIATYITGADLKDAFLKLHSDLQLRTVQSKGIVSNLEQEMGIMKEALTSVEKENMTLKVRLENLQGNTMKIESRLNEYGELLAHWVDSYGFNEEEKEAILSKYNLRKISEQEKQRMRDVTTIMEEIRKEEGHLSKEDTNKLKKRLKAVLETEDGIQT
jgi:integrase